MHIFCKATSKLRILWKALYEHDLFLTASTLAGGLSVALHGGYEGTGGLGCQEQCVLVPTEAYY